MKVKAVLTALVLSLLLVPSPVFAEDGPDGDCRVEEGSSIGIVLLIDQSSSLKNQAEMLPSIGEAIRKVGSRLQLAAQDDGVDVQLGIVTFGTEANVVRDLSSYSIGDDVDDVAGELSDVNGLEGFTDYIAGLEKATAMFDSQPDLSCRILLWFTDGFFDYPPEENDSAVIKQRDADLLTDAVCGDGALASRLRSRSIQTFAVLLKTGTAEKWDGWFRGSNKYPELHAGLSAMQAITGDVEIDDLPITDYAPLAECAGEIRESEDLGGEVLVGSRQLPGVLFTLLSGAIGGDDLIRCPTAVPSGSVVTVPNNDEGLPAGVMFSRLFITALDGEIGSISAVNFPGGPRQLFPSDETNLVDRDQVKDLPAGWKLEISSSGSEDLAVCVQADDPRLAGGAKVSVTPSVNKVFFGDDEPIQLTVDWGGAFEGADPAGVIGRWTVESEYLEVNGWADGADGSVTVIVENQPPGKSIEGVRLVVEPKGGKGGSETGFDGLLVEPILIEDYEEAPRFECSDPAGFGATVMGGYGVEVSDDRYESPGSCTVFPPLEPDTGSVEVSLNSGVVDGDEVAWTLVDSNGEPLPSTFSLGVGDEPVEMRFATLDPLENKKYSGSGSLSVVSTWSTKPAVTFDQSFDYRVDLKAKSCTSCALIMTLIVATIATILSLVLLRLLNYLLVKIPAASAFYVREIPIRVSPNSASGASWVPVGDGMQSDSFPVKSSSPGKTLSAGRLQIRRSLGPVWKPFSMPTTHLDGFAVMRSTPAARRRHSAPVAFTHLTVVGTNGGSNSDGSIDAMIVALYPRRFDFDETQVRLEVDRMVDGVAEAAQDIDVAAPINQQFSGNEGSDQPVRPDPVGPSTDGGGPPGRGGRSTRGDSGGSPTGRSGSVSTPPVSRPSPGGRSNAGGERPGPPPRREPPPRRS